jgi:hypothetical protein
MWCCHLTHILRSPCASSGEREIKRAEEEEEMKNNDDDNNNNNNINNNNYRRPIEWNNVCVMRQLICGVPRVCFFHFLK